MKGLILIKRACNNNKLGNQSLKISKQMLTFAEQMTTDSNQNEIIAKSENIG